MAWPRRKKGSKYSNTKVVFEGMKFDSKRELKRWQELVLLQRGGVIADLERQVRFPMKHCGIKICTYVADFTYTEGDRFVVEDCKGFRDRVYLLKKKLVRAFYGVQILET